MAAPKITSKRYSGTAPAPDKDDAAVADYKGSSTRSIKTGKGGSTKRRTVSARKVGAKVAPKGFGRY